jgi:hypothetical protein
MKRIETSIRAIKEKKAKLQEESWPRLRRTLRNRYKGAPTCAVSNE